MLNIDCTNSMFSLTTVCRSLNFVRITIDISLSILSLLQIEQVYEDASIFVLVVQNPFYRRKFLVSNHVSCAHYAINNGSLNIFFMHQWMNCLLNMLHGRLSNIYRTVFNRGWLLRSNAQIGKITVPTKNGRSGSDDCFDFIFFVVRFYNDCPLLVSAFLTLEKWDTDKDKCRQ